MHATTTETCPFGDGCSCKQPSVYTQEDRELDDICRSLIDLAPQGFGSLIEHELGTLVSKMDKFDISYETARHELRKIGMTVLHYNNPNILHPDNIWHHAACKANTCDSKTSD